MAVVLSARRRRALERDRVVDHREIVIINGRVMSCDEFSAGAQVRMARFDALERPFRELCNDMNLHAGDVATLATRGESAEAIRAKAERKIGARAV